MKKQITLLFLSLIVLISGTSILSAQTYCTSGATSIADSEIDQVVFNTISNNTASICATYTDFTATHSTTLTSSGTYMLSVTVGTCNGSYNKYASAWIDWNDDGDFTDPNEFLGSLGSSNVTTTLNMNVTVPSSGVTFGPPTRLRVIVREGAPPSTDGCGNYTWGETEDYGIIISSPAPMVYDSLSAVHNDTTDAFIGQIRVNILEIHINTSGGAYNPIPVKSAYLSLINSGVDPTDVANLKVFTSNGNPFSLFDTMGEPLTNLNGPIVINYDSGAVLNYGSNPLWFAYDISYMAIAGHILDLRFDSAIVDDTMRYPNLNPNTMASYGDPGGDITIVTNGNYDKYCSVTRTNQLNYDIGTTRIKFGTIDNSTPTYPGPIIYHRFNTPIPVMWRQKTYPVMIRHGSLNAQAAQIYIDWDNDGYFQTNEIEMTVSNVPAASVSNDNITIPCNASTGVHRMRVVSNLGGQPLPACGAIGWGEVEDYLIFVPAQNTPVVSFTTNPTLYVGGLSRFKPSSTVDGDLIYRWDYDNNGTWDDTSDIGVYIFNSGGSLSVNLQGILRGCNDTLFSSIYSGSVNVVTPTTVPDVNFIASLNTVTTSIPTVFNDLTTMGPYKWKWVITPPIVNGQPAFTFYPSDTVQNPTLFFNQLGKFDIKLIATNLVGSDSNTKTEYIIVVKEMLMCQDIFSPLASGYLYDDGGKYANYSDPGGMEITCGFLIQPKCASSINLDFLDFDVNSYRISTCPNIPPDGVRVYDGVDNTGIPLHLQFVNMFNNPIYPFGFMNAGGNIWAGLPPSVSANSGSMFVEFYKNCGALAPGFEAKWTTQSYPPIPPVASFTAPDTVYRGVPTTYVSTSTGEFLDYSWDLDGDGWTETSDSVAIHTYMITGKYYTMHIVHTCGGITDTIRDSIVVIDPTSPPIIDFTVNFNRLTEKDLAIFTDLSDKTVHTWQWEFTPNNVIYQNGTSAASQNVDVMFTDTGHYDVKLTAVNILGDNSLTKTSYIHIYEYCIPGIGSLNSDIGISEVLLQNIAGDTIIFQESSIGVTPYTDYSPTHTVTLSSGGDYILTLKRNTNFNSISRAAWIDYNKDGDFNDPLETLGTQLNSNSLIWTDTFRVPLGVLEGLSKLRFGTNVGILNNRGCGPNYSGEFEDYGVIISPDVNPPVIILFDNFGQVMPSGDTVTSNSCASFTDTAYMTLDNVNGIGYIAKDDVNGIITSSIVRTGFVDSSKTGYYTLTYNVCDAASNCATPVIRIVEVLSDIIPPVITINPPKPDYVHVNSPWNPPNPYYTVIDNCSGVKSDNISGNVNVNKVGTYTRMVIAEDNDGNIDTAYGYVVVFDSVPPTITLVGDSQISMEVNTSFVDPWVIDSDNYWSLNVEVLGKVDTAEIGTYFLSYCVTDSSGNGPVCVDREVVVYDSSAPIITLIGGDVTIDVHDNFIDPGFNIYDNYYKYPDYIIVSVTDNINTYQLGTYQVTYIATDASGNKSIIYTRTVTVVDRIPPTIHLIGNSIVTVKRWTTYVDEGAEVSDNYDKEDDIKRFDTLSGGTSTFENTLLNGLYTYTWVAEDASGNVSPEITRLVYVEESGSSTEDNIISNENISFYPNPAKDVLYVDIDLPTYSDVNLGIYNTLGEQVIKIHNGIIINEHFDIDIKSLSTGVYYIRFNVGSKQQLIEKFVITR